MTATTQFRNVVYLNNAAVTFMTQGKFRIAIDTIKDALFLLEGALRPTVEHDLPRQLDVASVGMIQKAAKYLAQLSVGTTTRDDAPSSHSKAATTSQLQTLCYDGSLQPNVIWNTNHKDDTMSKGIAVYMSDVALNTNDEVTMNAHSPTEGIIPAILLSNFALAHWGISQLSQNRDNNGRAMHDSIMDCALQLLHSSQIALGVKERCMLVVEGNLFLASAIVHNICFVLHQHGHLTLLSQRFQAALCRCHHQLSILKTMSDEVSNFTKEIVSVAGAA